MAPDLPTTHHSKHMAPKQKSPIFPPDPSPCSHWTDAMHHLPTSAHNFFSIQLIQWGFLTTKKTKKQHNNSRGCGFPRHPKNPMSRNHKGKSGPDKDGSWIGPLMPEAATQSTGGPYGKQIMTGLEKLNMMWIPWYHWSLPSSKCDTLLGIITLPIPAGAFEDDSYFSSAGIC